MENYFEDIEKIKLAKEQEILKLENFRPLSNINSRGGRNRLSQNSYIGINIKTPLKKSVSSIFPSFEIKKNITNDIDNTKFNSTNNTYLNISSLFNKDIKFTTLNENENSVNDFYNNKKNNYKTIEPANKHQNLLFNDINSEQRLLSKNFANLIKSNDFSPNLGKYDKKIILALNQKCKEIEDKYIKALKYYYQMENVYINEQKKKKDSEIKLNNSTLELNSLKNKYEKMRLNNIHLNNALLNTRNEIDRLNIVIRNDQQEMIKKQDEYNTNLKLEEEKRTKLRNIIKVNERQMSILQEKINDGSLSRTMKLKKYKIMKKYMENGGNEDEEREKDEEIFRLKSLIENLQNQVKDLQKNLKKDKDNKKELLEALKNKGKQQRFNNDNINLLFKTIEKQEEDGLLNFNLIKSKNIIIKNMKDRCNGMLNIPHYSLPKNIRNKSAYKISTEKI